MTALLPTKEKREDKPEKRQVYWNLISFALIGAVFSIWAMYLVGDAYRSEIAVLYLGLIGGYAASIKELDLARIEIDKLRAERDIGSTVKPPDGGPENTE